MRKVLLGLFVWFVVPCLGFALMAVFVMQSRDAAGMKIDEIDVILLNPFWDGRGRETYVTPDFWGCVWGFLFLWLGLPLICALGWFFAEDERAKKDRKKRRKREERIEDYMEALRRYDVRRRRGRKREERIEDYAEALRRHDERRKHDGRQDDT